MKRIIGAAAVAVAALLALTACSDPPTHGYVYSINYNPPGSVYWPGHWYDDCSGSGRYRSCYEEYQPGWTQYIPAEWQLDLCAKRGVPSKQNACGWRDVDSQTYHSVTLGQYWTSVASS